MKAEYVCPSCTDRSRFLEGACPKCRLIEPPEEPSKPRGARAVWIGSVPVKKVV